VEKQITPSKRHSQATPTEVASLKEELRLERKARVAAEAKCVVLEARVEELTQRVDKLLKAQNETHEMLQRNIRRLEKDVADRDGKIQEQGKTLAWLRKKVFGDSSEKGGAAAAKRQKKSPSLTKEDRNLEPTGMGGQIEETFQSAK
jgi:septation ring formation regulator EzrA